MLFNMKKDDTIIIRLNSYEKKYLKKISNDENKTLSSFILSAIEFYLKRGLYK